jgi:hypothetical protein
MSRGGESVLPIRAYTGDTGLAGLPIADSSLSPVGVVRPKPSALTGIVGNQQNPLAAVRCFFSKAKIAGNGTPE